MVSINNYQWSQSAFRQKEGIPLVVPEINGETTKGKKLIANPNCTTAIGLMAVWPLHKLFGLKQMIMSVRLTLLRVWFYHHFASKNVDRLMNCSKSVSRFWFFVTKQIYIFLILMPRHQFMPTWCSCPILIPIQTYQAASGAGQPGMDELLEGTRSVISGERDVAENKIFAHPLPFNVIPHIDKFQENGYTKEEMKVTWETRKICGLADDFPVR